MKPINTIRRSAVLLLAFTGLATVGNAQVINGSFESGVAYPNGTTIWASGTPNPWFATQYTPDLYDNTGNDGWGLAGIPLYNGMFGGMVAADGHRFIGFGANQQFSESFKEVMSPLTAGNQYTISAQMAVDDFGKATQYGGPFTGHGAIDVKVNGTVVGQFAPNTVPLTWEMRSVTFIAPTANTYDLEFVAQVDPLTGQASYMALDDIKAVPEPVSMISLALGTIGLAVRRRRAKSQ